MIELIQVHEPTNSAERVPKKSRVSEHAQFYTKKFIFEDGSEYPYSADINMIYGKQWNKITDSVNKVFGNPDSELRNRKITFQEYAERKAMKTNYNNRMVTDYEKENIEKPKFPENTLIRESSFPGEKPSAIRRIIARVKNICK